jgi:isochorismate hydrolase
MKETYFSPASIQPLATEMLAKLRPRRQQPLFHWQHAALLVLDMQDYFLDPDSHAYIPSALAIVPHIQELIAAFCQHGQPVVFTRHLNNAQNAASMARWWRDTITDEHPLRGIHSQFDTTGHQTLVKSQYDAFYQTDLETSLKQRGLTQVVITGVMTHLCCETTARSAFMRGFEVFFVVDGTATYNQSFHRASLLNLSHGFATPVLTAGILKTPL